MKVNDTLQYSTVRCTVLRRNILYIGNMERSCEYRVGFIILGFGRPDPSLSVVINQRLSCRCTDLPGLNENTLPRPALDE